MERMCQTCLGVGININPMSFEDMEFYRLFIPKLEDPLDVLCICVYCKGIIRKLRGFIAQSRLAYEILKNSLNRSTEILQQVNSNQLSKSETVCLYIGPETPLLLDKDIKKCDDEMDDDMPLMMLSQHDDYQQYDNDVQLSAEILQKVRINQLIRSETVCLYIGPETHLLSDNDIKKCDDDSDDDMPLLMLRRGNDDYHQNDSDVQSDNVQINIDKIKQEESVHTDSSIKEVETTQTERRIKKKVKKEKEVGEGFSSRMVTETDEYKVIKLTKEEILEEMRQHSQTDKYKVLPYKCENCVRAFNFEDVYQTHMEKHSPKNGDFLCDICSQYCPSRVSLRGHMKSHSTRYKCKLCGLVRLSRQHILEHHSLQHTGSPALYKCPKCDHTTNKRTAMQRHVRLHSGEPLRCHRCGKFYKSKESLRIHIMRHDDRKLHQCEVCSSTFIYAAQLSKHMRAVHELRDYYCVECDIMFRSMNNLKQHLQRAKRHRDVASYKFQCQQCDQKFISASTLATHSTSAHGAARSETCDACPRAYSSAEALRWHTRRAHGARERTSIPCPLCDRQFSRKYVLRVHMRTHTGERPHVCGCGAAFAQPAALRAHRAQHHKKSTAIDQNET